MSTLSLRLPPAAGEAWHSYLTRTASLYDVPVTVLADHVGIRRAGRWPGHYGVLPPAATTPSIADSLNITPADVHAMHLNRYDQVAFDLTGLGAPGVSALAATRQVAHQGWVHLAGSRYCPDCLASDGVWRLAWRIPWITTCTRHHAWLEHRCPACGGTPGLYTRAHGGAPSRTDVPPDTTRCDLPHGTGVCGQDLTQAPTTPAPDTAQAATQEVTTLLSTGRGTFAGQATTSLQTLRAWQATIGIAIALHQARPDPTTRNHRWSAPPRDPRTMADLLQAARPVAHAPTIDAAADVLAHWCQREGITSPHKGTFDRATRPAAALKPVTDTLLARTGRAHILLTRARHDATTSIPMHDWTLGDIPQVAWPCALPPRRRSSTLPDQLILRAVISIICARIHTGADWPTSGALLGIPADKARQWTHYTFSSRFPHLKTDLLTAAHALTNRLTDQPTRNHWHAHPALDLAHGTATLTHAQAPACRHDDPTSRWCPCTPDQDTP